MKNFGSLLLCLIFSSCLSDEEKRLQTDQSFEGEEMFNISFSLDEHVFYAVKPFDFYIDTTNYARLSGCPLVIFSEEAKEVNLIFGGDCETNLTEREGKIKLTYLDSLRDQKDLVRIDYEEYSVRGIELEGIRFIDQIDSSSSHAIFRDELQDFILRDAHNSTSKVNAVLNHEVVFHTDSLLAMDTIPHITTTGSGSGRNLAGRSFDMEITQPKVISEECIRIGKFVPDAGQERWTFQRHEGPDVVHTVNYEKDADCDHSANIMLYDGREMELTQ